MILQSAQVAPVLQISHPYCKTGRNWPQRNLFFVLLQKHHYYYYYEKVGTRFHMGKKNKKPKDPQGKQVQLEMTRIIHKAKILIKHIFRAVIKYIDEGQVL